MRGLGGGSPTLFLSGKCDYWVCEQLEHPVNADLPKLAAAVMWSSAAAVDDAYVAVPVGPACVPERCRLGDRFSLKTDRWTWQTFNEEDVPAGLVWYTTNLNCVHPRMKLLPFGLNTDGHGTSILPNYLGRKKRKALYVNFQDNTADRIAAKHHYAAIANNARADWLTFRPKVGMPVDQFYDEMADHQFVLCPEGTGLDSYRLWEALYLGCTPVVKKSVFAYHLLSLGLPVVVVSGYHLGGLWDQKAEGGMEAASLSWWRERLKNESS